MRSHIFCARLVVILLIFVLIAGLAVPAQAADIKNLTWDPGTSGFKWKSSANWSGPGGHRPNDNYDRAYFLTKGSTGNPMLDGNLSGSGGGLGQLVFNAAGWTVLNETGEDNIMNFSSVQWFNYDAIYSTGWGTNRIKPKVAFVQPGQNVYTSSNNTLVFEQLTGSNAFVVSSLLTGANTGTIKLEGNNSSITNAFVVRQGTLLVANNNALGSGSEPIYFGDGWSIDGADARLLADSSITVSKNLEVRDIPGHRVNATIGGSSGNSYFTGTLTLNRNAELTSSYGEVHFNNTISGTGGITKTGAGTVVLSGNNTYLGATSVNYGFGSTLLVNGTHTGGGAYTVSSNTILGGTGSIDAVVDVQSGGFLSPGESIGSLETGAVTLGGTLKIEIDGLTELCDLLDVNGSLDITNGIVDFDVSGTLSGPAYIFAEYNSLVGSQFFNVIDLPTGYTIDYNYLNSNQIAIIPEPATIALLGLGGLVLRRRK